MATKVCDRTMAPESPFAMMHPSRPSRNARRLDRLLVEQGHFRSREQARRSVMAGLVRVDGHRVDKPGSATSPSATLEIAGPKEPYVSRAGRKLAAALDRFSLDPGGSVCMDVGASTGGFTDCLLQRGAVRVYAIDVGYGQLDLGLRNDPRVVVMERVNARHLEPDGLPERADLITVDVSFISLTKIVPALLAHLEPTGRLLTLIKPQFEAGRGQVGKGGVVRDERVRQDTIVRRIEELEALGLEAEARADSEVKGVRGNREAFALFRFRGASTRSVP